MAATVHQALHHEHHASPRGPRSPRSMRSNSKSVGGVPLRAATSPHPFPEPSPHAHERSPVRSATLHDVPPALQEQRNLLPPIQTETDPKTPTAATTPSPTPVHPVPDMALPPLAPASPASSPKKSVRLVIPHTSTPPLASPDLVLPPPQSGRAPQEWEAQAIPDVPPNTPMDGPPSYAPPGASPAMHPGVHQSSAPVSPSTSKPTSPSTGPTTPAAATSPNSSHPKPPRSRAITKLHLTAEKRQPLTHELYLDPCLRDVLFHVPTTISTAAESLLSGASKYPDGSFSWTTGAPIGGMAKLAKDYIVPADAKFVGENGNVSVKIGVVDEEGGGIDPVVIGKDGKPVLDDKGKEVRKAKGRTKARVEVTTNRGGVLVDIVEMAPNRQIDLSIETRRGDVLVLLPDSFHGPIHVNSEEEPLFGPTLAPRLAELAHPYEGYFTTAVVPLGYKPKKRKNKLGALGNIGNNAAGSGIAHGVLKTISKFVPEDLRGQDDNLDMALGAYEGAGKRVHSKIVVKTEGGKVGFGYSGSKDAECRKEWGLRVGADKTGKHWWNL